MTVACALFPLSINAQIAFTDETANSGIIYSGESYGSSWGDYNGDGWPDAFVSNHRNPPALYVNLGNGTFENRAGEVDVWQLLPNADQHGGSWADFDNDGDQDLFIAAGASNNSQFLVNNGQFLVDRTSQYTFDVRSWGGRAPTWFDFTHDGRLDFAMNIQGVKTHIFQQTATDFVNANNAYGNPCSNTDFTQLADVTRDGELDWICVTQAAFPTFVSDITTQPFTNVTGVFPMTVVNAMETLVADFDGDLVSDAFVLKGKERVSGAEIVAANRVEAHLINFNGDEVGIAFQSGGNVTFRLHWNARSVNNIFIGAGGTHPPFVDADEPIQFTLSPGDPNVHGLAPRDSNLGRETIYIGFDPATQTWQMWNVADSWSYVYAFIDSTQNVSNLSEMSLQALDLPRKPAFLGSSGVSYVDRTNEVGFRNLRLPCKSLATADFDNDMDLDLFFVCRNAVSNAPDRLYENRDGVFVVLPDAGGAAGPVGPGTGLGEGVSVVDYDVDGFVDLLVHNGLALFPAWFEGTHGGPDKLYRNSGNANNWIEIDLVGTTSNRDAIGARVIATAGGVSQLREQGGNYKRWTQSHQRLHFGLGPNATVDLQVTWPSGSFQAFNDVDASRLYRVTEGNPAIQEVVLPPVEPSACGVAAGLPIYTPGTDLGVFMGKDCVTGTWMLRVSAGAVAESFHGAVTSTLPFTAVTGISLEGGDTVDTSDPRVIDYGLGVGGPGDDGFNFSFPAGAGVCFDSETPAGVTVQVGRTATVVSEPFDLDTLGPCVPTTPPDCGLPTYDRATEQAVFIARDCDTGVWQLRATAGGSGVTYSGSVVSDQAFLDVTGFSFEGSDVLNWTTGGTEIGFSLSMGGSGQDGFDFSYSDDANVCVDVSVPMGVLVFRGADRELMSVPFDLETGGPCTSLPTGVSAGDAAALESDGTLTFTVSLSAASSSVVSVDYQTVDGSATAPADYVAASGTVTFDPGQTQETVDVTLNDDGQSEGVETFQLVLDNAVNTTLGANGTGTITDDEAVPCGLPAYDSATERAAFIGRSCEDGSWQVRMTAGGSGVNFAGNVMSDLGFATVTGFSLESSDTVDWTSDPGRISYSLNMGGSGQDGFAFTYPAGANVCFGLNNPPGAQVYLSPDRIPVTVPFDPESLGPCP